jgi:DNA mismatch repair protein MSH2
MSGRLLRDWIRTPLTDLGELQRRQNYIEAIMQEQELRSQLDQDLLRKLPDIDKLVEKLDRWTKRKQDRAADAPAHIKMLVQIHDMLVQMPRIVDALQAYTGPHASVIHGDLGPLQSTILAQVDRCRQMVEDSVDLRAAQRHEFRMRSDQDEELQVVDQRIRRITKDMQDEAGNIADEYSLETSKVRPREQHTIRSPVFAEEIVLLV